jgi:hypothetical protein
MRTFRRMRRGIAAVLLVLCLPACTSWRPARVSPQQLFLDGNPKAIRVSTAAGRRLALARPWVAADTLRGYAMVRTAAHGDRAVTVEQAPTAIALADITLIEVGETSPAMAALAVVRAFGAVAIVAAIATCDKNSMVCAR